MSMGVEPEHIKNDTSTDHDDAPSMQADTDFPEDEVNTVAGAIQPDPANHLGESTPETNKNLEAQTGVKKDQPAGDSDSYEATQAEKEADKSVTVPDADQDAEAGLETGETVAEPDADQEAEAGLETGETVAEPDADQEAEAGLETDETVAVSDADQEAEAGLETGETVAEPDAAIEEPDTEQATPSDQEAAEPATAPDAGRVAEAGGVVSDSSTEPDRDQPVEVGTEADEPVPVLDSETTALASAAEGSAGKTAIIQASDQEDSVTAITCVCCRALVESSDAICLRCETDNTRWIELRRDSGLVDYIDNTFWVQLLWAAILMVAAIMLVVINFRDESGPFWIVGAIVAIVLCVLFYFVAFALRWRIREYEWQRREMAGWRPSILTLIVFCFLCGCLFVFSAAFLPRLTTTGGLDSTPAIPSTPSPASPLLPTPTPLPPVPTDEYNGRGAIPAWPAAPGSASASQLAILHVLPALVRNVQQQTPQQNQGAEVDLGHRAAPLLLGFALGLFALGFSLAADLVFADWLNQHLPRPIFADRARMARVLRREAELMLRAGLKSRNWEADRSYARFSEQADGLVPTQSENRRFERSVPPQRLSTGMWETLDGQENIRVQYSNQLPNEANDSWQVWENRPDLEVRILQMQRTRQGGARVWLAVVDDDAERSMREGEKQVLMRLQGLRHYELLADLWGWPLDLREIDDHRLVQLVRRDVSLIDPPQATRLLDLDRER